MAYSYSLSTKKHKIGLFLFLCIISLFVLNLNLTKYITHLRTSLSYFLFPEQKSLSDVLYSAKDLRSNLKNLIFVYAENRALKTKLTNYHDMQQKFNMIVQENIKLNDLLQYSYGAEKLIPARVIARSVNEWYRVVCINKGLNAGVSVRDIVVVGKYPFPCLVGQVVEVYKDYSRVLLITDSNSSVASYLMNSKMDGIVEGRNNILPIMKYIADSTGDTSAAMDVQVGDKIITSGLGGIFPYGIYVGTIFKVVKNDTGKDSAIIKTAVNFKKLRDVFVVVRK